MGGGDERRSERGYDIVEKSLGGGQGVGSAELGSDGLGRAVVRG